MNRKTTALLTMSSLAALGSVSHADTVVIPDDVPTLELALNPALNLVQPGDTIELTTSAVYFASYSVTIADLTIRAADGQAIVIDPFGTGPGFSVDVGAGSFTLEGATVQNGANPGSEGGGVNVISAGALSINGCRFEDNSAERGGAIWAIDCDVVIDDTDFVDNTASVFGGAIRSGGTGASLTVRNGSTFTGNDAMGGNGGAIDHSGASSFLTIRDASFDMNTCTVTGGSVFVNSATVVVENARFSDNEALGAASQDTGGIFLATCPSVLIRASLFERNLCPGTGGAIRFNTSVIGDVVDCIFNENGASGGGALFCGSSSTMRVTSCTFDANTSLRAGDDNAFGGAARVNGGALSFVNSLFTNNVSTSGGAIDAALNGDLAVTNCTFIANDGPSGGGAIRRSSSTASAVIKNSIVWDNTPLANQVFIAGSGTDIVEYSLVQGGYAGAGNLDADPLFVEGLSDFRLGAGSPAIDAGDSRAYSGPLSDLAGVPRGQDDENVDPDPGVSLVGAVVDMGAYEFGSGGSTPGCGLADVAEPYNVLDFSDVLGFLTAFGSGCP